MILISGMTASDDGTEELSDISILSFPELELGKCVQSPTLLTDQGELGVFRVAACLLSTLRLK